MPERDAVEVPPVLAYATPPEVGGGIRVWADRRLVVTAIDAAVSDCCVRCGEPETLSFSKTFRWHSPVFFLAMVLPFFGVVAAGMTPGGLGVPCAATLIAFIILIIVSAKMQRTTTTCYGLCERHAKTRRGHGLIAVTVAVAGVALFLTGLVNRSLSRSLTAESFWLGFIFVGFLLILLAMLYAFLAMRVLRVVKITDRHAWFAGAGDGFLNRLPRFDHVGR